MNPDLPAAAAAARVLVVDDSPTIRYYHRSILVRAGFLVTEAENGYEALELVVQQRFDVLVVDVNMPVMDGFSLLDRLREEASGAGVPAVMVSSEAGAPDTEQAYRRGADAYLVKPVDGDALTAAVAAALTRPRAGSRP